MTKLQIRKATRKKLKARIALIGPSGSGKTFSSLLLAKGLGKKVLVVDTENRSAENYVGNELIDMDFDVISLEPPYEVSKYIEALSLGEDHNYDVIILDSISHAWAGEGGLLDLQGKITETSKSGNSYTAWRQVTPLHNKFVESMVQCKSHLIVTMRSKTEYVLEPNERGQLTPKKVGMAPIQREGLEYEFTVAFDLNSKNLAVTTKDRTNLFNGFMEVLTTETGMKIAKWADDGEIDTTPTMQEILLDSVKSVKTLDELKQIWSDNQDNQSEQWFIDAKEAKKTELTKGGK